MPRVAGEGVNFNAPMARDLDCDVRRRADVFGVTAVDQPSGERGVLAKVLLVFSAVFAHAASLMQPGDTHAVADLESRHARPDLLDAPDDLMAGNNGQNLSRQFTFDHVQIGAADAADADFHSDLTRAWLWSRRFGQFERVLFDRRDGAEQTCFHIDLTNRSQPSDAE